MFGKKNQAPKIEAIFQTQKTDETKKSDSEVAKENDENEKVENFDDDSFDSNDQYDESQKGQDSENQEDIVIDGENLTGDGESDELSEKDIEKIEKLDNVQDKISKILKSSNIELVDENQGDSYEYDEESDSDRKQQEDYDSLKAIYGSEKAKHLEVTLTEDDYDYTYIGQYVDELDILHIKNIKHVRLQNKHSKLFKWIVSATAVIVAIIVGVVVYLNFFMTKPVFLESITLSQTTANYYVDEEFLYSGRYIIAHYSDGTTRKIPLDSEYYDNASSWGNITYENDTIHFNGGTGNTANLVFSYGGCSATLVVNILQKEVSGIGILFSDGLFNIAATTNLIDGDYLILFKEYQGYGKERVKSGQAQNFQLYLTTKDSGDFDSDGTKQLLPYNEASGGFQINTTTNSNSAFWIVYNDGTYRNYVIKITNESPTTYISSNT